MHNLKNSRVAVLLQGSLLVEIEKYLMVISTMRRFGSSCSRYMGMVSTLHSASCQFW